MHFSLLMTTFPSFRERAPAGQISMHFLHLMHRLASNSGAGRLLAFLRSKVLVRKGSRRERISPSFFATSTFLKSFITSSAGSRSVQTGSSRVYPFRFPSLRMGMSPSLYPIMILIASSTSKESEPPIRTPTWRSVPFAGPGPSIPMMPSTMP